MKLEKRAVKGIEYREYDDKEEKQGVIGTLTGYAAVFDSDSEPFEGAGKPWVERISRGAFARTLQDRPEVRALWNHGDTIIARAPNTMTITEDERGLRVEIDLIDTSANRDLLANIRSGNVDSMSFGFRANKVEWEEGEDRDIRTLKDVELFEVSPVIWPAYPDTSIAQRDHREFRSTLSEEGQTQPTDENKPQPDPNFEYIDLTVRAFTRTNPQ